MALEDIVKGLRTVDENPVVNPNYNPKTLIDTIECIGELEQINIRTQEGLAKYREITGLPTKDVPREKTELFYEKNTRGCNRGIWEIYKQTY
ncbi:MAG: hypothetical protein ABIF18_03235 [archaeon]